MMLMFPLAPLKPPEASHLFYILSLHNFQKRLYMYITGFSLNRIFYHRVYKLYNWRIFYIIHLFYFHFHFLFYAGFCQFLCCFFNIFTGIIFIYSFFNICFRSYIRYNSSCSYVNIIYSKHI